MNFRTKAEEILNPTYHDEVSHENHKPTKVCLENPRGTVDMIVALHEEAIEQTKKEITEKIFKLRKEPKWATTAMGKIVDLNSDYNKALTDILSNLDKGVK